MFRMAISVRNRWVLTGLAAVLIVTGGCTSIGEIRELRGSLSKAEATEILDQAEAAAAATGVRPEAAFRCWFDRIPSGSLRVPCGPVEADSSDAVMGGPPPYFLILHIEPVEDEGAETSFRLVVPASPAIDSLADYPVDLFRPDGERIRP
jgi:hypothetical protein